MPPKQRLLSLVVVILTTSLSYINSSMFTIEAEKSKAFDKSCLIGNFSITSGKISDCLEHCLENCACQSFQVCQETTCQLCSSNKKDNSSLLHEKEGCIYAMYKIRHLPETFQKLAEQCSNMSCALMKYNCCSQQTNLCRENQICKPIKSLEHPWKRFTCECKDGYHGHNCEPITSCRGYSNGSRISGTYIVLDSNRSLYEVYCHFDSDGSWTLLQSYSFANGSYNSNFHKSLSRDLPVSENALSWSGYRLSKARMESIQENSTLLRFTCDSDKHELDVNKSDHLQVFLADLYTWGEYDVLENGYFSSYANRGKIGGEEINECQIYLHQEWSRSLHAHIYYSTCEFVPSPTGSSTCTALQSSHFNYFGSFSKYYYYKCLDQKHQCVQNQASTTQLWFGHALLENHKDTFSAGSNANIPLNIRPMVPLNSSVIKSPGLETSLKNTTKFP